MNKIWTKVTNENKESNHVLTSFKHTFLFCVVHHSQWGRGEGESEICYLNICSLKRFTIKLYQKIDTWNTFEEGNVNCTYWRITRQMRVFFCSARWSKKHPHIIALYITKYLRDTPPTLCSMTWMQSSQGALPRWGELLLLTCRLPRPAEQFFPSSGLHLSW